MSGFLVLDLLAAREGLAGKIPNKWSASWTRLGDVFLVKPATYMNHSGEAIVAVAQILQDPSERDVDRDRRHGAAIGAASNSAHRRLRRPQRPLFGDHAFRHSTSFRVCASASVPRRRQGSTDYVLGRFFEEEKPVMEKAIERAADAVKWAIDKGVLSAMNTFNKSRRIMKNRYEALLVLNTQGREDSVKEIVDRLESEFQKEGAEIEQVQKMDKRPVFLRGRASWTPGIYVNFVFHADPQLITKLRSKFKLDPEVYRQALPAFACQEGEERALSEKVGARSSKSDKTGGWPASIKSFSSEISPAIRRFVILRRAAQFVISAWP